MKKSSPRYLFKLIPTDRQTNITRNKNSIPLFNVKHNYLNFFFLPFNYNWMDPERYVYISWLAFIRPSTSSTFHCHCPDGLKLIERLRLGLSHLRFYKFKHNFEGALNPICSCGTVETNIHYLLHCPIFSN